jgi:hypothetical protein
MNETITRQWAVRDAVLMWLYTKSAEGNRHPVLMPDAIAQTTGWSAEPLTREEVDNASVWLRDQGLLSGDAAWGGGVPRPAITAKGESFADKGRSVRSMFDEPAAATPSMNFFNSGTANFAVNSPGAEQSNTVTVNEMEKVREVVKALEKAAVDEGVSAEAAAEAREIAEELRSQVEQDNPDRFSVKRGLLRAAGAMATSFGTSAGAQLGPMALEAVQAFM